MTGTPLWITGLLLTIAGFAGAQPIDDPSDLDQDGEPGTATAPENPSSASALVGSGAL